MTISKHHTNDMKKQNNHVQKKRINPNALQEMIDVANRNEGVCLETNYLGYNVKHRFRCKEGHEWKSRPDHIKFSHSWCPTCSSYIIEEPIKLMHELASAKNGKALENEFKGVSAKHMWQCSNGHKWSARFSSIRDGKWCPECSSGRNERLVRYTIEALLGCKFEKTRPAWLINPQTGRLLELDCFNESLKIAIEYQGIQHYEQVSAFKMTPESLAIQQERDRVKRELCEENGIILLEVPYTVSPSKFPKYVYDLLKVKAAHVINQLTHWRDVQMVEWVDKHMVLKESPAQIKERRNIKKLATYAALALTKKGVLLSNTFFGVSTPLLWECSKGHQWKAAPADIKKGHWCKKCSNESHLKEEGLDILKTIAARHGGALLSENYHGYHIELSWKCSKGHQWKAVPQNIFKGLWCPICSGHSPDGQLEQLESLAKERGGKLLSKIYMNSLSKLEWQCKNGHIWSQTPKQIKKGLWCKQCTPKEQLQIAEKLNPILKFQRIALEKGGVCLSTHYDSSDSALQWRCKNGHTWESKPRNITEGYWCPHCAKTLKLTLTEIHRLAQVKGGICKDTVYINNRTNMLWQCANGHEWYATAGDIKKGRWCKKCYIESRK